MCSQDEAVDTDDVTTSTHVDCLRGNTSHATATCITAGFMAPQRPRDGAFKGTLSANKFLTLNKKQRANG